MYHLFSIFCDRNNGSRNWLHYSCSDSFTSVIYGFAFFSLGIIITVFFLYLWNASAGEWRAAVGTYKCITNTAKTNNDFSLFSFHYKPINEVRNDGNESMLNAY